MLHNGIIRLWSAALIALALCAAMPAAPASANPLDAIASFFGIAAAEQAEPAAAFDETTAVDPNTMDTWKGLAEKTTENVGRIWTDKTVSDTDITLPATGELGSTEHKIEKNDSDFLIGLSALSSTSNMISTTSKPLDIVLVLDTSGSMDDAPHFTVQTDYYETYDVSEPWRLMGTGEYATDYYALVEGKYVNIKAVFVREGFLDVRFDHWTLNGVEVNPKTYPSEPNCITFYEHTNQRTKLEVTQSAVDSFIDATRGANAKLDAEAPKHRLSIVAYESTANTVAGLTEVTDVNVNRLDRAVYGLSANGATRADLGMDEAQDVLMGVEETRDSQQVVIFFTDGEPTQNNEFSPDVANAAIDTARTLKNTNDALVYSIGIFTGADVNATDQNNRFMQAVSSNYPNATGYETQDMGDKNPEGNYYRTASDADSLNQVFEEIFEEISTPSLSPITSTHGATPDDLDTVTFTDQLGAYMQVDAFKEIVFADQVFQPQGDPQTANGVTTYRYSGEAGNPAYPEGNLSQIVVEVKHSNDLATGDIVTVKIPASVLPLRSFTVETDAEGNEVLTVDEQYPIRIFYGVSLKDEVAETLADGICIDPKHDHYAQDQALGKYIKDSHKNGKVPFYSNYYNPNKTPYNGKMLGDTTTQFVPASTNSFYYFTEDTPVFVDEQCNTRLKYDDFDSSKSYYYEIPYYELDGDKTVAATDHIKFEGKNFNYDRFNLGRDADGNAVILAGSPRLTRVDALTSGKTTNKTGTATEVINPLWDSVANPETLTVYLGNNGKLDLELAGALAITKDARIAPDKNIDPSVTKGKDFEFELTVAALANKTVKGEVRTLAGEQAQSHGVVEIEFDRTGKASYKEADGNKPLTLQDDETLYIYGLDAGVEYSVNEVTDENTMPKGFELTGITVEGTAQPDLNAPVTGTIEAGQPDEIVFTNTYDVEDVTLEDEPDTIVFAGYEKNFDRWDVEDEFTFTLNAIDGAPMPDDYTGTGNVMGVTVNKDAMKGSFGKVTFKAAGDYYYTITEERPLDVQPGMTYSNDTYVVHVEVTDNGEGALKAVSTMYKQGEQNPIAKKIATFTNTFAADSAKAAPDATKVYVNNSGAADKNLRDGMFSFVMAPKAENPANDPIEDVPSYDQEKNQAVVKNTSSDIRFDQLTFTDDMVSAGNAKYAYTLSEDIPNGATEANGYKLNGMTYDPTKYEVEFVVSTQMVGGDARVSVAMTYYKLNDDGSRGDALQGNAAPEFHNEYNVDPVEIPGEGGDIKGRKTLVGRDLLDGESYSFTMTAGDNPTQSALASGAIKFGDNGETSLTETVNAMTNRVAEFSFGDITFTKPGTYVFHVEEDEPADPKGGMTYDTDRTVVVTVPVVDNNGALKLGTVTYAGSADGATDAAAFVNRYEASTTFGASTNLTVVKRMTGRALKAGEFDFTITAADNQVQGVTKDEAAAKLPKADQKFSNTAAAGGVAAMPNKLSGMRFDQDDAGKTFTYVVDEVTPGEDDRLPGVTYDEATHTVAITVNDDGEGKLSTSTTVDGDAVNIATAYITFNNGYQPIVATVDTDAQFGVSKKLVGRDWKDTDTFTFNLEGENGAPMPAGATGGVSTVSVSGTDVAEGSDTTPVKFGTIAYNAAGVYRYTVTEVEPADNKIPGVEYDGRTVRFTVTVTDRDEGGNHTGKLTATVEGSRTRTFTNEYSAELANEKTSPIKLTKQLNGRDMEANEFEFAFESLDGTNTNAQDAMDKVGFDKNPQTISNNEGAADGAEYVVYQNVFGKMKFDSSDLGKTYKYKVSEVKPETGALSGVQYDSTEYTLEISVADLNGDGTLTQTTKVTKVVGDEAPVETTVAAPNEIVLPFVNTYEAGSVGVDTSALFSKTVQGRDWLESDAFSFTLKADDPSCPMPKDDEGKVVSSVTVKSEDAKKNEKISFGFGNIMFTDADMAGATSKTFTYSVTEDPYTISGMKPQDANQVAKLAIKVTDDGKGQLLVTTDPVSNGNFVNVYSSGSVNVDDPAVSGGIVIQKNMTGRAIGKGDFTFTMTPTTPDAVAKFGEKPKSYSTFGAPLGEGQFANQTTELIDVKTDLVFGLEDVGKDFSFTVAEVDGNKPGYDYDLTTHALDFVVTDNTSGTLTVTVKLDGDVVATWSDDVATRAANDVVTIPFSNSYAKDASATANIAGTKTLTGRPMAEGEFTFILSNSGKQVATAKNAADGTISFPQLSYDMATLNSDADAGLAMRSERDGVTDYIYTYDVAEDTGNLPEGVTAVTPGAQSVKVVVTDDGAGNLSSAVTYPDAGLVFQNAYGAGEAGTAELQLGGTKELKVESADNAPDITGKFTFTLSPVTEGAPMPAEVTATNDASGSYAFGKIAFDMSIFGEPATTDEVSEAATSPVRTKTFEYKVTESGTVPGVVNDAKPERHVVINVTDNGDGSITAKLDTQKSDSLAFVNTYKVGETTSTLTGDGGFTVTKSLTGRPTPLAEGEFTFVLRDADGNEVARGVNDANGKVQIADVKFSSVGTQTFTLEELDNAEDSIECMTDPYKVTASATDNGDGTLKVTWTVEGFDKPGDLAFENVYTPKPTSIILKAAKVLTGRDLKEGEFEFVLSENGKKIDTAKNDALGGVTFDAITYTEPGVHEYTVTEVPGDVENVTYDDTVFTITVTVTDDGSGKLSWTHEFGETGEPVFKNAYEEPKVPEPKPEPKPEPEPEDKDKLPGTGDDSMLPVIGVATAGVAAAALGVYLAKRKDDGGRA